MPDIAMCDGAGCGLAEHCYRHRAVPDEYWQAWISLPLEERGDACEYFWDIRGKLVGRLQPFVKDEKTQ